MQTIKSLVSPPKLKKKIQINPSNFFVESSGHLNPNTAFKELEPHYQISKLRLKSQSPNMHFSAFATLLVASSATIFANPVDKRADEKANEYASRFTFEIILWHSELINVRSRSGLVSDNHSEKVLKDLALRYPTNSVLST